MNTLLTHFIRRPLTKPTRTVLAGVAAFAFATVYAHRAFSDKPKPAASAKASPKPEASTQATPKRTEISDEEMAKILAPVADAFKANGSSESRIKTGFVALRKVALSSIDSVDGAAKFKFYSIVVLCVGTIEGIIEITPQAFYDEMLPKIGLFLNELGARAYGPGSSDEIGQNIIRGMSKAKPLIKPGELTEIQNLSLDFKLILAIKEATTNMSGNQLAIIKFKIESKAYADLARAFLTIFQAVMVDSIKADHPDPRDHPGSL